MRHGQRDVRVEEVADPIIQEPTDAVVRITSIGLCAARTRSSTPSAWWRTVLRDGGPEQAGRPAARRAGPMMNTASTDRMAALNSAFDNVRRGGTTSLSGVCGGMADPMPMLTLFDKQVPLRMGRALGARHPAAPPGEEGRCRQGRVPTLASPSPGRDQCPAPGWRHGTICRTSSRCAESDRGVSKTARAELCPPSSRP